MDSEKSKDFYGVLGLKKECSPVELRSAYKKLAMKWHPDRCSMAGNVKLVEEAKTKFQAIQEAYSVLSDPNKRFLYDCGVYDCEDEDDKNGMGEFLNEMAAMMNQNKPSGNAEESFAELQDLFEEIFETDVDEYVSSSSTWIPASSCSSSSSSSFFPTQGFDPYKNASANKRDSSHMMNTTNGSENMMTNNQFEGFNIGVGHQESARIRRGVQARGNEGRVWSRRDDCRKHKVSSFGHASRSSAA